MTTQKTAKPRRVRRGLRLSDARIRQIRDRQKKVMKRLR
jgi:hypothetical protein